MKVILCLVQLHLNGLNNFERVGSRWRVTNEVDALPPAETRKQSRKRQLVMQDRHITLRMLSVELNVSRDTIRAIMRDDLGNRKVCAKFLPHLLTPEKKTMRMESCGNFVEMVEKDESVLSKIVTGDETWCFMYDPTTKRQSAEWVCPKNRNRARSAWKNRT
jgi:hypothetical protein